MFLRSSATTTTWSHVWLKKTDPSDGLKSHSPLTLYVLSNEGVIHYVTVICFQYFLKFSNVIVLVSTGRKKQTMLKCYREHGPVTQTVKHSLVTVFDCFSRSHPCANNILQSGF